MQTYLDLLSYGDTGWSDEFARGIWLTIQISFCGYLIGLAFGLLGAWAKLSGNRAAFLIAETYTTIIRAVGRTGMTIKWTCRCSPAAFVMRTPY